MHLPLVAAALTFTTLAACAAPRAALVGGTLLAAGGGLAFGAAETRPVNRDENVFGGGGRAIVELIGLAAVVVGGGLALGGVGGLLEEPPPPPPPRPVDMTAANLTNTQLAGPTEIATGPSTSRTVTVRFALGEQLTTQLGVESHTGHCSAASATAHRLARIDPARLRALVEHDQAVASCLDHKM